jgi:hypothetical protein
MKDLVPVEGEKYLFRDMNSNAIINTSTKEYDNYTQLKNQKEKELGRISQLENDFQRIKNDLDEIKSMLKGVLK